VAVIVGLAHADPHVGVDEVNAIDPASSVIGDQDAGTAVNGQAFS